MPEKSTLEELCQRAVIEAGFSPGQPEYAKAIADLKAALTPEKLAELSDMRAAVEAQTEFPAVLRATFAAALTPEKIMRMVIADAEAEAHPESLLTFEQVFGESPPALFAQA